MQTARGRRRTVPLVLLAAGVLGTAAGTGALLLGAHGDPAPAAPAPSSPAPSSPAPSTPGGSAAVPQDTEARIHALLGRMTLEDKVGQLFVSRVYGGDADHPSRAEAAANRKALGVDTAAEAVARYRLGGVVYFGWAGNLGAPERTAALSAGLQHAAGLLPVPVPLLVATDQEQGSVVRIGPPATVFPGAMALGASGRAEDARTAARTTGAELAALGVNQDYAPVADVNVDPANPVIGIRSFGSDPGAVAALTAAQVDGFHQSGTAATAKHFPGHGDTGTDSHTGLPVITHDRAEWERVDAPPFAAAIRQGVDSVMTAHIAMPALDPSGDPATLSRPILTGLLRERLHYDGVVITDSLDMAGVRERYGDERVPVLALKAGADQLLNPPDLPLAYRAVLRAVRSGELPQSRIDASVLRVLRMKAHRGLFEQRSADPAAAARLLGTPAHRAAADAVADHSITLLRDDDHAVPLGAGRRILVTGWEPAAGSGGVGTAGGHPVRELADTLTALGHPTRALPTGRAPDARAVARAVAAAGDGRDAVLVLTSGARTDPAQQRLVRALLATGRPVLQLAVGTPYDLAGLPGVRTALASYSWQDVSMRAVARVLAGRVPVGGRLPVAVPGGGAGGKAALLPLGFGLRR
ncbi:glycoside hydrolase family 3 protein [Streptomyces sp. NPDC092296]|uniref:glycoside hydrolase family 3 protein n=1 Tax=Streptomyces sp. NPDC092296 TaxID=3366012 RepID=UPI0037F8DF59